MDVVPFQQAQLNQDNDVATVSYLLDGGQFEVQLVQSFHEQDELQVTGISEIRIFQGPKVDYGDAIPGLTGAHLRAVPVREAADALRAVFLEKRASEIIGTVPMEFQIGDWPYAKLAEVLVRLKGWGIANPTVAVARAKEGENFDRAARDRWAMRVKRARTKGYLGENEKGDWYLTATAMRQLG